MASSSSTGPSIPIIFSTQTPYPLPSQKFMLPASWKRYHLSQLVNKALSLAKPVPFDFIIKGGILRTSLAEWCSENGVGEEETLEIEYVESVLPPQKMSDLPHEDWVSSVSCHLPGYFFTASYDGYLRAFDYSQKPVFTGQVHSAPITSMCFVPSSSNASNDGDGETSQLVATSSHDLSAQLSRLTLSSSPSEKSKIQVLASLHLHTGPVSSVASTSSGKHILTSSWDSLIGLWDTSIPSSDEVPEPSITDRERKKRRRLHGGEKDAEKPKRKAPLMVLKSHTARVSRIVIGNEGNDNSAYSCGFDSTVRIWDVENGICSHTITASEKPFLDIALNADGQTALAASTDRTITMYDVRESSRSPSASSGSLLHPATPSGIASGTTAHQVVSGAYDGIVRIWDLRSQKNAMASFKAWEGKKKVLSVDWKRGMVGVGGEGGLEVWKAVEDVRIDQCSQSLASSPLAILANPPGFSHLINRVRIARPPPTLPVKEQFKHILACLVMTSLGGAEGVVIPATHPGLKKIPPYWYPYTTYAKERWLGRELLEVVSTEFRDRSMEYYRYALESGVTTINGKIATPNQIIQNGDRMENVVHRHEPPVSGKPVKILLEDKEREFLVVDKPGSIPVHAAGRYHRNTLAAILTSDFGYEKVYAVNRLDRLTSGLMIIPLSARCARRMAEEFVSGTVRKEYVARCKGEFSETEVVCEEPLLTIDRQMGLNIVHPEGKSATTIFQRIRYDANTDSSVVLCKPLTGRSHQIRVHLQYLGHPIANDPVYSEKRIWGSTMGKGGLDLAPSDERSAPKPPEHLADSNSESLGTPMAPAVAAAEGLDNPSTETQMQTQTPRKLLPRETGEDIGMGSPVPLSSEAVEVITRLRNMKDEAEDWSRWRDVVFRAKGNLRAPRSLEIKRPPPQNRRKKNRGEFVDQSLNDAIKALNVSQSEASSDVPTSNLTSEVNTPLELGAVDIAVAPAEGVDKASGAAAAAVEGPERELEPFQLSTAEAIEIARKVISDAEGQALIPEAPREDGEPQLYCPECYLPLHPDPKPEKLYIFLHALRYTTSLGCFETEMPEWSAEGWTWDRD
ncbi:hypothetical protein D9758_006678 [Tetrapyrgos nigripes]|uniref:Ribosome biogenesis protein YTM1 n=1 Tax=Tetrapyrgos nigripes TaxID=182062 RepID=A0A8H5GJQ7_9AGAR|nr:hypothetical protein D9758_006678 [Tetrapyrgos nigripes]